MEATLNKSSKEAALTYSTSAKRSLALQKQCLPSVPKSTWHCITNASVADQVENQEDAYLCVLIYIIKENFGVTTFLQKCLLSLQYIQINTDIIAGVTVIWQINTSLFFSISLFTTLKCGDGHILYSTHTHIFSLTFAYK